MTYGRKLFGGYLDEQINRKTKDLIDVISVDDGVKTTILDYMRELNWD